MYKKILACVNGPFNAEVAANYAIELILRENSNCSDTSRLTSPTYL